MRDIERFTITREQVRAIARDLDSEPGSHVDLGFAPDGALRVWFQGRHEDYAPSGAHLRPISEVMETP